MRPAPPEEKAWRSDGPCIGWRLHIKRADYEIGATVHLWLPAAGVEEPALWKVNHDDGDVEDLERHEIDMYVVSRKRGRARKGMKWEGGRWIPQESCSEWGDDEITIPPLKKRTQIPKALGAVV